MPLRVVYSIDGEADLPEEELEHLSGCRGSRPVFIGNGASGRLQLDVYGGEGTFSLCSFWYVEALTRAGRLDDARIALEKMFTYANHLGLHAEQIGLTGEHLGNFRRRSHTCR